jgi:ABC-type glycerol-3-phosphate transport system substrate-binding protein
MKKYALTLVAALVILGLVLTACGPAATPETVTVVETVVVTEKEEVEVPVEVTREVQVEVEVVPEAEPVEIVLWTKEGEADGGLQFVQSLADAYTAIHPNITFEITNKDVETLREDFLTAGLAGSLPDLLWTVNDHAGPFTDAELIMPVDDLFDLSLFVDSALAAAQLGGQTWGVPLANGNHLMLLYNKSLIETPPANTDELIAMGQELTTGDQYGLVWAALAARSLPRMARPRPSTRPRW